jgi:hypothetical protein
MSAKFMVEIDRQRVSYIYAIRCGRWLVKIGHAENPNTRLCSIAGANPFTLTIEQCLKVPWLDRVSSERFVHGEVKTHHVRGEWFSASADLIQDVFSRAQREIFKAAHAPEFIGVRANLPHDDFAEKRDRADPAKTMERQAIGKGGYRALINQAYIGLPVEPDPLGSILDD